jgi:hypothetical protein
MPNHVEYKEIARAVLAAAERWLGPADRFDYLVRRSLMPVIFEQRTPSIPHQESPTRHSGLSDIQDAIGQQLRAQCAVQRSMPARLAHLLKEFEQRSNNAEAFARDRYASAA